MDTQHTGVIGPQAERLSAAIQIIEFFMQKHRALEEARGRRLARYDNEDEVIDAALAYEHAREELAQLITGITLND